MAPDLSPAMGHRPWDAVGNISSRSRGIPTQVRSIMTTEEVTRRHSHVPSRNRRQPVTSYRIQLSAQFDFAAVEEIIPYLSSLGVTDVFFSPFCRRRRVQCTATMSSTTNAFRLTSAALRVFAGSHVRFTKPACTSSLISSPITWLSLRRSSTIARCGQPSVMVRSLRIAPGLMLRSTTPARTAHARARQPHRPGTCRR